MTEYYDRIQKAIDYIEINIKKDIDPVSLAKVSFLSVTHFYRIFQGMVGDSVKSYIQKRRLSHAAMDILKTDKRIIDIAFEYRYNSQEVFTRAFYRAFEITPGKFRIDRSSIVLHEKANLVTKLVDSQNLGDFIKPKIILNKAFNLVGMKKLVKPGSSEIKDLWNRFMLEKHKIKKLLRENSVLGLCEYMPNITDDSEFYYFAGNEVISFDNVPVAMVKKEMPAMKYAKFSHKGSLKELRNTYNYIYGEWLPSSGYELVESDTIEVYDTKRNYSGIMFDIYIPIQIGK